MKGLIYEIQRYCVDDGPGIRTVVFLKGCPLRCLWCHNPESHDNRQEIGVHINRCIGCMKCYEACPRGAIIFNNGERIDREACDRCGLCVDVCPSRCLVKVGRHYEADELLFEILKDIPFYRASNGGVTFSGGEPIYQSEFLREALSLCKKKWIHTTVETSGYAPWEKFENIIEDTDLFLYDLKIWDGRLHKKATGGDNSAIKENFINLFLRLKGKNKIVPRIPLIPHFTLTRKNLESWAKFLAGLDCKQVHLLPFHDLGESKKAVVGRGAVGFKIKPSGDKTKRQNDISGIFESKGISVSGGAG
jgi:pyruvate formate lyase activating enzyme